ncbi:MAG: lamin tail domain-containing protein, partial [Clostridia bacterium]|nr:lamin tail domain-containing protein [Clostridia bacterium]
MRKRKNGRIAIYMAAFLALLGALVFFALRLSEGGGVETSGHPVRINEIMSSNRSFLNDAGRTPDWIELFNAADYAIDLSGYRLTDNNRKIRYTFPAGAVIEAAGYYVVWCEKNRPEEDVADFAIDKAGGEAILLLSARSVIVDSVETVSLMTDEVMARGADGAWTTLGFGTPGFENTQAGYRAYLSAHQVVAAPIVISELQSSNAGYPDAEGRLYDWIELFNAGGEALDISGFRISDKRSSAGYSFPEGTVVPAGGYLVLYCNRDAEGEACARFSLSSAGGETVTLWNAADMVLDEVQTIPLEANASMIRTEDGEWRTSNHPTPGFENTEAGYAAYLESRSAGAADIRVTEVMPSNRGTLADGDGDFSDWIELTNFSGEAVDLAGWSLSDRVSATGRWTLPSRVLEPGESLLVFASGKDRAEAGELHASFLLSRLGETVYLYSPMGMVISSLSWSELAADQSACLGADGEVYVSDQPTPGYSNDGEGFARFAANVAAAGPLVISEVMTGNGSLLRQADGQYYDWVELENVSGERLLLSEYYLSDDADERLMCRLPEAWLEPGERTVLLCSEAAAASEPDSFLALSLSAAGDSLLLSDAAGRLVDHAALNGLTLEGSYGRMAGEGGFFYFENPTPGEANHSGFRAVSGMPAALTPAGLYEAGSLSVALEGAGEIFYTTDGSLPTSASTPYTGPITVTENTVIRAVCREAGKAASRVLTASYFLNSPHSLPVVSVSTDWDNIFGEDGLLDGDNRYDRELERYAHVEFFDGEESFSLDCGIKLHGGVSRERSAGAKHSFKLVFRARYGESPLEFPLFEEGNVNSFYSLLLRSGEDSSRAMIRDELLSDIAARETEGLLTMRARYCVLYINGEYRGLYALKEAFSSGYYAAHYGVSRESVEMHRPDVEESADYLALRKFVSDNDMTVEENYRYVAERIDLVSMADWCIYEAYMANSDISVNVRFYRSAEGDGK